jgi:hypothetical protein
MGDDLHNYINHIALPIMADMKIRAQYVKQIYWVATTVD